MIKPETLNPHCAEASLELLRAALSRYGVLSEQAWAAARARFYEYRLDTGEFFLQKE